MLLQANYDLAGSETATANRCQGSDLRTHGWASESRCDAGLPDEQGLLPTRLRYRVVMALHSGSVLGLALDRFQDECGRAEHGRILQSAV